MNTLHPTLDELIAKHNTSPEQVVEHLPQPFVKAGRAPKKRVAQSESHLLSKAKDWKLIVDYDDKPIVFPPTILSTNLRPDIIIWSERTKTVIWAELTCPAEENIRLAQSRKNRRYKDLAESVRAMGWTLYDFTIEVGARGCVANSLRHFLKKIGLVHRDRKTTIEDVALVAARASYHIYLASRDPAWVKHALLCAPQRKLDATI